MKNRVFLTILLVVLCLLFYGCEQVAEDSGSILHGDEDSGPDANLSSDSLDDSSAPPSIKDMPPPEAFKGVISISNSSINVIKSDGSLWSGIIDPNMKNQIIPLGRALDVLYTFDKVMDHVVNTYVGNSKGGMNETCFAITEEGSLWGWGLLYMNDSNNDEVQEQLLPKRILDSVTQVCQIKEQFYALKKDGSLWVWGKFDDEHTCTPRLAATGVTKLLSNEEADNLSVWFLKENGNAYRLVVRTNNETSFYFEEKLVMENVSDCWGKMVITGDGQLWDMSNATDDIYEKFWDITDDGAIIRMDDAIQITDRNLQELSKYIAVGRDGHLIEWTHFNKVYYRMTIDDHMPPVPPLNIENCRYFICGLYGDYRFIDMDGNLRSVTKEGVETLIDENVCYGYGSYYIKSDGNLYMTERKNDNSYDIVKVLDDVMIPW